MNNNIYDNEATILENSQSGASQKAASQQAQPHKSNTTSNKKRPADEKRGERVSVWPRVAASAAVGVAIGALATMAMSMAENPGGEGSGGNDGDSNGSAPSDGNPSWAVGDIAIATTVTDDMSFNEAFAAARAEVGPGGAFEWHGGVYGTYTAVEWNNMTAAEHAQFEDHFSWNHFSHTGNHMAHHSHQDHNQYNHTEVNVYPVESDEVVAVVSVDDDPDKPADSDYLAQADGNGAMESSHEIEILGVTYDAETDSHFGNVNIDGQEVILVDVDGDMQFDYMGVDINSNAILDSDEIMPIHDMQLSVDDLGGLSDQSNEIVARVDEENIENPVDLVDLQSDDLALMEDADQMPLPDTDTFADPSNDFLAYNDGADISTDCYEG